MITIQRIFLQHRSLILMVAFVLMSVIPSLAFAQLGSGTGTGTGTSSAPGCSALFAGSINTLKDIVDYGTCLVTKSIVPLLLVVAIAVFVYGIVQYFLNPNNINERDKAKQYILWALIGMFVLFSISGLIQIIRNTFGITGNPIPLLPETQ
jgi:hypothetical protein